MGALTGRGGGGRACSYIKTCVGIGWNAVWEMNTYYLGGNPVFFTGFFTGGARFFQAGPGMAGPDWATFGTNWQERQQLKVAPGNKW